MYFTFRYQMGAGMKLMDVLGEHADKHRHIKVNLLITIVHAELITQQEVGKTSVCDDVREKENHKAKMLDNEFSFLRLARLHPCLFACLIFISPHIFPYIKSFSIFSYISVVYCRTTRPVIYSPALLTDILCKFDWLTSPCCPFQ